MAMGADKLKRTSNGYSMCCLHPDHSDRSPSLHYKISKHKFSCYGCGFNGDIIDIVSKVKGIAFMRAIRWLKDFAGWSASADTKQLQAIIDRRERQKQGDEDDVSISNVVIPAYYQSDFSRAGDLVSSYIKERKWSVDLLHSNDIGYCEHGYFRNRIIFPVYGRDDKLNTFAARAVWRVNEDELRYQYPLDSKLSVSIWGVDNILEGIPIFLEGCPDALRLREYGYNAYACMGNQLGDKKLDIIRDIFRNHDTIMVIPDGDKGGDVLKRWFGKLVHQFNVLVGSLDGNSMMIKDVDGNTREAKDIDELGCNFGRDPVDKIISNAVIYHDLIVDKMIVPKSPTIITELVKDELLLGESKKTLPVVKSVIHSDGSNKDIMNRMYWAMR